MVVHIYGESYRFGFNGQEKENKIYGEGNTYSAEYWMYDSRLGRRWNLDPIPYPFQSSYCVFNNNPIFFVDPEGLEGQKSNKPWRLNLGLFTIGGRKYNKGVYFKWNTSFDRAFMSTVGGLRKAITGAEHNLSLVPMGRYAKTNVDLTFKSFIKVEKEYKSEGYSYKWTEQINTNESPNHTFTPSSIARYNYYQNKDLLLIKDINSLYLYYNFFTNPDHLFLYRKSKLLYKRDDLSLGDFAAEDITDKFYYKPMLKNPNAYLVNILVGPKGSGWMFSVNFSVNAWMKYDKEKNKRPWFHKFLYGTN
ncbi:MAG: hypothetical protein PF481_05110 [Bacteroidales bacterium]|jgi:hypothetical protein|nr:hypothetical protein [Bacteroidales bacterium]